jgi:hypothetical protein
VTNASKTHHIRITEAELARLIEDVAPVAHIDAVFGAGGVALVWRKGEPLPRAVERLAELRGAGIEGRDGEGI